MYSSFDVMSAIFPKCKSNNIIPIMYGYPTHEALKKMLAERGHKIAAMIELAVPEDEHDGGYRESEPPDNASARRHYR